MSYFIKEIKTNPGLLKKPIINKARMLHSEFNSIISFEHSVKTISYEELKELYLHLTDFIQENNAEKENTTIGELTVLNNPTGLIKKSKFDLFKESIFKALSKENLSDKEKEMVSNAEKLINQLTGKK